MGKMNFSNITEDEYQVVPAESVEIIPPHTSYDLSNNAPRGNGQALANAVSPVAAITNCINTGLEMISTISKCIAIVAIEKQKTEQVKATMNARIIESKQQTKRVQMHEKEETKRLVKTFEFDLKNHKLELEKLRDEYEFKGVERDISHKEFMQQLKSLERTQDTLQEVIEDNRTALENAISEKNYKNIENCLHELNKSAAILVEFSNQIAALKGMK